MIARYQERGAAHRARRDAEARLSARISRLRLAAFLPGAACLAWVIIYGGPLGLAVLGVALLTAFTVLVFWHARVDARAAWYDALHIVNLHALARIGRAWDRLPPAELPPAGIEHHPYALDLDLFGRASLMQWLGPLSTASGATTMQEWLLRPSIPTVISSRQSAVSVLSPMFEWREQLAAHGRLAADVRINEIDRFLHWAESPAPFTERALAGLRAAVRILTASIWILMALDALDVIPAAWWSIPIVIGTTLWFAAARRINAEFDRADAGQHAFARYADLFAHAAAAPKDSPALDDIHSRLEAPGTSATGSMRSLNRIIGFAQLRIGAPIFHFAIQAVTLWDFHVFFALDRWRARAGTAVRGWMQALGELDALSAFAQVKTDNPDWCLPEVFETTASAGKESVAKNLGHPLISRDRSVGNDVEIGPPGTLLLITGSNMSGKSTLLRAIGLNAVLAQAGGPVCAASLRMPPVDLETCIRVQDSLEHGLSYFMAALARLKGVVDRAKHPPEARTVLYLLDEILQGTNTAERAIAVRAIAQQLLSAGAIGVMTTHDLALATEKPLDTAARLVHFTETVDEHGAMSFDYRLRPGLATSRNALRLMHLIGIDLQ